MTHLHSAMIVQHVGKSSYLRGNTLGNKATSQKDAKAIKKTGKSKKVSGLKYDIAAEGFDVIKDG